MLRKLSFLKWKDWTLTPLFSTSHSPLQTRRHLHESVTLRVLVATLSMNASREPSVSSLLWEIIWASTGTPPPDQSRCRNARMVLRA